MSIGSTFKVEDFIYKILSKNEVLIGIRSPYESASTKAANAVNYNTSYYKDVYIPNYVTYKGIECAVSQV